MLHLTRPALLLALMPTVAPCMAQWDLTFQGQVPVTANGANLDLAWAGGLNFVQVSDVDLNGDGLKDLFLFDRSGNTVTTLMNTGGQGTNAYRLERPDNASATYSGLHDWALFRDYDCDGKADLFTQGQAGFGVYRNTSVGDTPSFELITSRVNSRYVSPSGTGTLANLYVSQVDLPAIDDIDGDGDLDVLTFSLLGSYMEYHKNLSMELYGTCDSLVFELRNKCWGYFAENFNNNSVTLDTPCDFNVPNPELGEQGDRPEATEDTERAHAGSTILSLDLNGDGVKEVLIGDISYNNLVGLYNGGSIEEAYMIQEDTLFPSYDNSVDLALFPAGYYVDVDQDGKRDLLVGGNATSLSENKRSLWYYTNTGTDSSPVFEHQQEDLFQERMIDVGEGAFPVFFDHDRDGLMDLIVANHGYFAAGGVYTGKLALFRNTGTMDEPSFELITDDYMGLSTSGIGISMYPAFGDVDGDGDLDMYIGDLQGRIHAYRNTGGPGTAQFELLQPNVTNSSGEPLDVGQFATPVFEDLDGDGLLDLLIGERNGNLNHYRNTGSASLPVWSLVNENVGGVSTVEWWNVTGYSVPSVFRNASGERELLLGSESGWLYHYGAIDNNLNGTWTLLDSTFLNVRDGIRTGVALHDLTGDGELELIIGNYRGGLSFWGSEPILAGIGEMNTASGLRLAPNPAAGTVEVTLVQEMIGNWQLDVVNGQGQVVMSRSGSGQRLVVDVEGLANGVYTLRVSSVEGERKARLMVMGQR
jgi:hypothetical protein